MFWGGHSHSFFFSLSCLLFCSRAWFLFSSRPLSHALCAAFAYLLSSPLLFVWGTHTSSYAYACSLPPFSSPIHSFVLHSCRTPCVDTMWNAAANSPLAFLPTVSGFLECLSFSSRLGLFAFFWRRPSLGVLALCIHGMLCYLLTHNNGTKMGFQHCGVHINYAQ